MGKQNVPLTEYRTNTILASGPLVVSRELPENTKHHPTHLIYGYCYSYTELVTAIERSKKGSIERSKEDNNYLPIIGTMREAYLIDHIKRVYPTQFQSLLNEEMRKRVQIMKEHRQTQKKGEET